MTSGSHGYFVRGGVRESGCAERGDFRQLHASELCPAADESLRSVFSDAIVEAHLEGLIRRQQDDGRWQNPWGISGGSIGISNCGA